MSKYVLSCLSAALVLSVASVVAFGQNQSQLYDFESLRQEVKSQGMSLPQLEAQMQTLQGKPGNNYMLFERVLARLAAHDSPDGLTWLLDYIPKIINSPVASRAELNALSAPLSLLGDRYRLMGNDQRIIDLLLWVARNAEGMKPESPNMDGPMRRHLAIAAISGLARAGKRADVESFKDKYPNAVRLALKNMPSGGAPESVTPKPQGTSTSEGSCCGSEASGSTLQAITIEGVDETAQQRLSIQCDSWQWVERSERYESFLQFGHQIIATGVYYPRTARNDLVWFWIPSGKTWITYSKTQKRYLNPTTLQLLDTAPTISLDVGAQQNHSVHVDFPSLVSRLPGSADGNLPNPAAPAQDSLPPAKTPSDPGAAKAPAVGPARGIAVVIGLDQVDPKHYGEGISPLRSCKKDASEFTSIVRGRKFECSGPLLDENATREAVLEKLQEAAKQLDSGDCLLVYFAGHGTSIEDRNEDEPDKRDEAWCLYDGLLIDDELQLAWTKFRPGVHIAVLSDSCSAGNPTRTEAFKSALEIATKSSAESNPASALLANIDVDEMRFRFVPADKARNIVKQKMEYYATIFEDVGHAGDEKQMKDDAEQIHASILFLSGCQDNQLAAEVPENGLFTAAVKQVLHNGKFAGNWRQFHAAILEIMPLTQSPDFRLMGASAPEFLEQTPFSFQ